MEKLENLKRIHRNLSVFFNQNEDIELFNLNEKIKKKEFELMQKAHFDKYRKITTEHIEHIETVGNKAIIVIKNQNKLFV